MAKYIDKDEVGDMLRRWGQEVAETNSAEADAFEAVAYELQYFPEDDVVPVRHGRWRFHGDCGVTECSVCGWSIEEYVGDYAYCPNCGARMDGGDDGETD